MIKKAKIITLAIFATSILAGPTLFSKSSPKNEMQMVDKQKGVFVLLPLPYPHDALEPYIDTLTMELHHDKHHQTYVDNLNKAVKGTKWEGKTMLEMFSEADKLPVAIKNNAGGHWNHTFYWNIMTDDKEKRKMPARLEQEIVKEFGSVEKFRQELKNTGLQRFGSGYAWLIKTADGKLKITSTANQDSPLMNTAEFQGKPLLLADVWEHAYYLKYHNLRGDFLDSFWNVISWHKVDELFFQNP
jgi:superoxide dismutase, Fe-Mn family